MYITSPKFLLGQAKNSFYICGSYYYIKMQIFVNSVFHSFIRELARTTPKSYFNGKKVIQSSVGLIFRLHTKQQLKCAEDIKTSSYDKVELLFTQRAGYEGDRNAYNIVFPGGQCDEGESDLLACKRQLFEEIGLKVDQQCFYLGQLPSNFYYLQKRKKNVYISCHVWCLQQQNNQWKEKLNPAELRDSKWVNVAQLLTDSNYLIENSLRLGILERMASKYKLRILAEVSKNVLAISTPELNLGMGRNLWGLTLWIWSYVLQMACVGLIGKNVELQRLQQAKAWIKDMQSLQVTFKQGFLLKYPSLFVIKSWQYFNRIRPFTYRRSLPWKSYIYVLAALLFAALLFTFV